MNGNASTSNAPPLSSRKAAPLDLKSVELRGSITANREIPKKTRAHGLTEAPTYRPSLEEWKDPIKYIQQISPEGRKYGIVKIIPPESWDPKFAIDTERFHFKTRKQELNSCEGGESTMKESDKRFRKDNHRH
jgi:histone demethylase JARID1